MTLLTQKSLVHQSALGVGPVNGAVSNLESTTDGTPRPLQPGCHVLRTDATSYPEKPGGWTKPPNSRSINLANSIVVRSSSCGPTICTPMGKPASESPIGAAVAGRPGTVATLPQTRKVSIHGRFSPSISMTRDSRGV